MLQDLKDIIEHDKKFKAIDNLLEDIINDLFEECGSPERIGISQDISDSAFEVRRKLDELELIVKRKYMQILKKESEK